MTVDLPKQIAKRMRTHLRKAGRREIGGILMGEQIAAGHFRLVDFSVDAQTSSEAHFVRSPEIHRQALEDFFASSGANYAKFNYLGEWHSHPSFSVSPSGVDYRSMMSLVEAEQDINFAILMILRLQLWIKLEYSVSLFERGREPVAVEVRRTTG
jgi:[CysO sulfur-carrier protein]-S-L-cysteine hydrolase